MYIHSEDYKFIFCDFEFSETGAKHGALYQNQKDKGADMLFAKLLNRHNSVASNAYTECMSILYSIYSTLRSSLAILNCTLFYLFLESLDAR